MAEIEILETDRDRGGGNTKPHPGQGVQRLYWSFTWNNYENIEILETILRGQTEWYVFQEEVGASGTPHLQGTLCLKKKQRLTELKHINLKIHWEPTKCVKSSIIYCQKKETSKGRIYSHGIEIPEELEVEEPWGWQEKIMEIIKEQPDKRTIHWFWEPSGGVGKTSLCKYLVIKHNALMLSGKSNDMYHMISKFPMKRKIILIDVPRSTQDFINYGAIEQIKNGLIFSGKYEGSQLVFNCPHVIVFANEEPDKKMMSKDRWNIIRITT